jgi:hypothetical protein
VLIRGVPVTGELNDILTFLFSSFVRPTVSELFSIKHKDIAISDDPPGLMVTVREDKTGFRVANTLPAAAFIYQFICERNPNYQGEDYIFLPQYRNRKTASQIIQRQFRELMRRAQIEKDPITGKKHTLYSMRHTAICERIIMSEGQVNIFNLAKNAGTSVDQIERFYARHLPLSRELARNLQIFGTTVEQQIQQRVNELADSNSDEEF